MKPIVAESFANFRAVMMYIRYPLSLRQVEDLLSERAIDAGSFKFV